jgi:hypothetical protein
MFEGDVARFGVFVVSCDSVPDLIENDVESLDADELKLESPVAFPAVQDYLLV